MFDKRVLMVGVVLVMAILACSIEDLTGSSVPAEDAPIVFEDDFSDASTGWEVGEYENGSVGYGDGVYRVISTEQGGTMWGLAGRGFTNTDITVEATQVSGPDNNGYGVGCRIQENDDGYYMRISGDGFYSISKAIDGNFEYLQEWDEAGAINQGNATNEIRVVCSGDRLELYANGRRLGSATDSTYTSGDITLTATTFEAGATTEIHFDNIVVREP